MCLNCLWQLELAIRHGHAAELAEGVATVNYQSHRRVAKKRMRAIKYTRGQDKKARLYRDLIAATEKSLGYLQDAAVALQAVQVYLPLDYGYWKQQVAHFKPLICQVIEQTERRVFQGEKVPAGE